MGCHVEAHARIVFNPAYAFVVVVVWYSDLHVCRTLQPHQYRDAPPMGGGGWHKASVSNCLPLAAPIGLSPLLLLTLCGSERVLVVSTEPLGGGGGGWHKALVVGSTGGGGDCTTKLYHIITV